MPDLTHLFVSAIADGTDSTQVQPGDWNDRHQIAVPTTGTFDLFDRHVITGTDRLTLAGTGRVRVSRSNQVGFAGFYAVGSPTIVDSAYLLQYKEARLVSDARATIQGSGEWFLFDLAPVGRLVLAGRGG